MRPHWLLLSLVIVSIGSGCELIPHGTYNPDLPETRLSPAQDRVQGQGQPYTSWERQTKGDIGEDLYGTPLPDGSGLLFSSNRHGPDFKLYLKEPIGNRLRRVTSGDGSDAFATVSPTGERIAFASNRDGLWQLYLQDGLEASKPERLGDPGIEASCPEWSPDGKRLVYSRRSPVTGAWQIWMLDVDSSGQSYLTDGLFPAFSPMGDRIVFQRHRERGEFWFSLWTVKVDGTHEQEVLSSPDWGVANPSWSPNGEWIAFNSASTGPYGRDSNLYVVRPNGTGLRQLTFRSGPEWNPCWSTDGQVYFNATQEGETAIWSIRPQY